MRFIPPEFAGRCTEVPAYDFAEMPTHAVGRMLECVVENGIGAMSNTNLVTPNEQAAITMHMTREKYGRTTVVLDEIKDVEKAVRERFKKLADMLNFHVLAPVGEELVARDHQVRRFRDTTLASLHQDNTVVMPGLRSISLVEGTEAVLLCPKDNRKVDEDRIIHEDAEVVYASYKQGSTIFLAENSRVGMPVLLLDGKVVRIEHPAHVGLGGADRRSDLMIVDFNLPDEGMFTRIMPHRKTIRKHRRRKSNIYRHME